MNRRYMKSDELVWFCLVYDSSSEGKIVVDNNSTKRLKVISNFRPGIPIPLKTIRKFKLFALSLLNT